MEPADDVEPLPDRYINPGWGLDRFLLIGGFMSWTEAMFFAQRVKPHVDLGGWTPF